MRLPNDPKVDCVFKALLGAERNRTLLIHFLNAVLGADLPAPIREAQILNPYNEREFLSDKLSVVEVKARDESGHWYQIEIQLLEHRDLPARILYGWADLYSAQLQSGRDYGTLRPTYAIWLLGEALLPDEPDDAHNVRLRDERGRVFVEHGGIWLLELSKFPAGTVETEQQRWLKFFTEADRLNETSLPVWMQTDEMRQAMTTLKEFSEKERAYHAYQSRQNYLRVQHSMQRDIDELREQAKREREAAEQERAVAAQERAAKEQERAAKEQERAAKEQERAAKEQECAAKEQEREAKEAALAEVERLKRLLARDRNRDPED
jgi:predicted transposase/invertase (TIGR01784 family)